MPKLRNLIILLLVMCSCAEEKREVFYNYDDVRNSIINWNDVFKYDYDYYVYFYSERCSHCNNIKQDVISFYLKDIVSLYFVCCDIEVVTGQPKNLIGVNCIDDFYIFGTPFLIEIDDSTIIDYYVGGEQIKEFISILDNFKS